VSERDDPLGCVGGATVGLVSVSVWVWWNAGGWNSSVLDVTRGHDGLREQITLA
jgi:hypothetical protein